MSRQKIQYECSPIAVSPLEPILRAHLLMLTGVYCENTGYSRSSIALYALGNGRLFNGLIDGPKRSKQVKRSTLTLRNYDTVVAYLAGKWPTGLQFPTVDDAAKSLRQDANHHGKASRKAAKQEVRAAG